MRVEMDPTSKGACSCPAKSRLLLLPLLILILLIPEEFVTV